MKMPESAMVLAAGLGTRMRPLTDDCPKPLLQLGKQTILDYTLDRLEDAGVKNIVVNAHYKRDMILDHVNRRGGPVRVAMEEDLLDTGGGIAAALPVLKASSFFLANADTVWVDGLVPTLERLAAVWDPVTMDALLLLVAPPEGEPGDYSVDGYDATLTYRPNGKTAPYMYGGLAILHARLFQNAPAGAFRINPLWDKAERKRRLCGVVHNGRWYHLGTPQALAQADAEFRAEGL